MNPLKTVHLASVPVGDGHPTVFVAEAGSFFNKDVEMAERYLRTCVAAGVPVFKTEILHDPDICLKGTGLEVGYQHAEGKSVEDYRAYIERKILPLAAYRRLFDLCHELKTPFVASVFDFKGAEFLADCGGAAAKLFRQNITNLPLIRKVARLGLPIIFDAGFAYLDEVARAVRWAREEGAPGVIVNHHPGHNPSPASIHHFEVMRTYREALACPVGLSCHYRGEEMLYVAIGMGAHLLEKGVDDNPDRHECDIISATPLSELPRVLGRVRACWESIGQAPAQHHEPRDLTTRSGMVAARAIAAGEILSEDNLRFAWPPIGIPVERWDEVVGKRAAHAVASGAPLRMKDVCFDD
ncbi:MAG: N-acetylneuraminate synthase family protein [Chthoniobacter sp.]|nr:N-acetylneuraminate synthase family protein [Chthoniobacter sp.]